MSSAFKSLYDAKTQLSALVERAAAGEEIIIAKNGIPMAKLVGVAKGTAKRKPGGWEGKVWVADDFDAPLTADELALFEDTPIEPPSRHTRRSVVARRR